MPQKSLEEIFGNTKLPSQSDISKTQQTEPQQTNIQPQLSPQLSAKIEKSPLGIMERLKLSFADDAGREKYLQDRFQIVERLPNGKFAAGNNPNEVNPIDPEGLFNDVLGDLADVVSEIPVIAGQIFGSIAGGTAGSVVPGAGTTGGIIAGGAGGAAAGETVRIGLGQALGVRENNAIEEATDIAIVGAFGAAGEALIPASKFIGRKLTSPLLKQIAKTANKTAKVKGVKPSDTRFVKNIAKLFHITAAVPEQSTLTVFDRGIEKTLGNPRNLEKKTVIGLAKKLEATLARARSLKGKAVGEAVDEVVSKTSGKIDVTEVYKQLRNDFIDMGILDEKGVLKRTALNRENKAFVRKLLSELSGSDKLLTEFPEKVTLKKSIKDLIRLKRNISDNITPNTSPEMNRILARLTNGDKASGVAGIRTIIDDLAEKTGSKRLQVANREFHDLMEAYEQLRFTKKTDVVTLERFIRNLENLTETQKASLQSLDDSLPSKLKFFTEIDEWNAAQDFVDANPNILRFNAIASRVGLIGSGLGIATGFDTPTEQLGTVGGALLFGTPAGARIILRNLAKSKAALNTIPRTTTGAFRKVGRQKANAVVSRLLQQTIPDGNQLR